MLEHWHPQLIREEAAFVLSMDREEALNTRVAKILAWVNMFSFDSFPVEDKIVLKILMMCVVYIASQGGKFYIFWNFLPAGKACLDMRVMIDW